MSPPVIDIGRNVEAASKFAAAFTNGAGKLVAGASEFVELAMRNQSAWLRDLATVKSVPEFVQVQTEYAKANYAALIEQAQKNGRILSEIVEGAVKGTPLQTVSSPVPAKREKLAA